MNALRDVTFWRAAVVLSTILIIIACVHFQGQMLPRKVETSVLEFAFLCAAVRNSELVWIAIRSLLYTIGLRWYKRVAVVKSLTSIHKNEGKLSLLNMITKFCP